MKRPLFVIGLSYAVTTWVAFFLELYTVLLLSGALAVTGILLMVLKRPKLRPVCLACLSGAIACAGFALYHLRTVAPLSALDGKVVEAQGLILESTHYSATSSHVLLADFPENPELPQGQRVRIRTRPVSEFGEGDSIQCALLVYLPDNTTQQRYYTARGIHILGVTVGEIQSAPTDFFPRQRMLTLLRSGMQRNLEANLDEDSAQLVGAMTLGLKSQVDSDLYTAVGRSGTVHLLTVSGLHLSIIAGFLLGLFRGLRLPRVPASLMTILFSFLFALFTGLSASVVRAFIMTSMVLLGGMLSRRSDGVNSLGLALLVICIIWPHWTQGRGMWLSAASTLGILLYNGKVKEFITHRLPPAKGRVLSRLQRFVTEALAVSISAYAFSLPILLVSYGWFSLISPVANLLVTPFVIPTILGGILCAFFGGNGVLAHAIFAVTGFCSRMVVSISGLMASLPFAVVSLDQFWMLILAAGVLAGIGLLVFYRADRHIVSYALLLCVVCYGAGSISLNAASRDKLELITLTECDSTILLRDRQAVILGAPDRYQVSRLLQYLGFRGVERISAVVATDYGEQIDSGLLRLVASYPVDCVIGPDDDYILGMLSAALPGCQVLSGGYSQFLLLEGAVLTASPADEAVKLSIGDNTVLKTGQEYAIISGYAGEVIRVFSDGALLLPAAIPPLVEPVGGALYGETRVLLDIYPGG